MSRFHRWARRQLWWYALLVALAVTIGWATGSLSTGTDVVVWIVAVIIAASLVINIVDGWLEWKERRKAKGID